MNKLKAISMFFSTDRKMIASLVRNICMLMASYLRYGKNLYLIALTEHIGDIVACEPIIRHLYKENPHAKIVWITFDVYKPLVKYHPQLHKSASVSSLTEWIILKKLIAPLVRIYDLHMHMKHCSKYGYVLSNENKMDLGYANFLNEHRSLLSAFSGMGGITNIEDMEPIFPLRTNFIHKDLPQKYVVIHTKSNSTIKDWDAAKWRALLNHFESTPNSPLFIEIGLQALYADNYPGNYINLCGQLDFQEIAFLIKNALLFIGIDSGFAHIAHATSTPKIVMMGSLGAFESYNPFSGASRTKGLVTIKGQVSDISTEMVIDHVTNHLQSI